MAPSDTQHPRQTEQRSTEVGDTSAPSGAPSPRRRNDESWVEVASQPSSSSLSSIGDDIVTTGLSIGSHPYLPRRRRPQQQHPMPGSFIVGHPASQAGMTSSQEEYDETESDEDRVMTSSTEAIHPSANLLRQQRTVRAVVDTDSDSDGDENATALGRPSNTPVFRPQPNAFSHPPSHLAHRHSTGSAQPFHHHHSSQSRPPIPHRAHTRSHRGAPNFMSPSYQADNDAALRASLTTLLTCAAAARGLPKPDERRSAGGPPGAGVGVLPSSQPMELRLVPESELMAEAPHPPTPSGAGAGASAKTTPPARTASNSSAPSAPSSPPGHPTEKTKRAASSTAQTRPARAAKKKRTAATLLDADTTTDTETGAFFMSPTLLTWVMSAGVVVLVSVVGFGAGYVIGREVGRHEGAATTLGSGFGLAAPSNASSATTGCGSELVRSSGSAGSGSGGMVRSSIRWGSGGRSVVA